MAPPSAARRGEGGFTLLEAMVALAILSTIVIAYLGVRTRALMDATEARNWRLAREIAEEKMSELQAGARDAPPDWGDSIPLDDYQGLHYKGFRFKFVIGESQIADLESEVASSGADSDPAATDRSEWQRNREQYRKAQARGISAAEYRDELALDDAARRLEENAPSADEFEEVAVVVFFPRLDPDFPGQEDAFVIKARLSTLSISGLTPEQAESLAASRGQGSTAGGAPGGAPMGNGGKQ